MDLLKLRLDYLKNTVDIFVIVESKLTFTNNLKEKYFAEEFINNLPNELKTKIRYVQINPQHINVEIKNQPWEMKKLTRNAISFGLTDIKYFDFLWITDIDEIPNKNKVFKLGKLSMFFSYYKMNLLKDFYCKQSKSILSKHIMKDTPDKIRWSKWLFGKEIKNGFWHFSYLMNEEKIAEKVKSFSHTEFAKEKYTNLNAIKNKKDLFGRESQDLRLEKDLSFLPEIVTENLKRYEEFIDYS